MSRVKVAARVRPLSKRELEGGARSIVDVTGKQVTVWNPKLNPRRVRGCGDSRDKAKCYCFDYVYSCDEADENVEAAMPQGHNMAVTTMGQELIFDNLGLDVLNAAFEGYNACIFAYGQTGSGKTYTMMGGPNNGVDGLIPRICQELFRKVEGQTREVTSKVDISYMEVYNEKVRDLLQSTSATRKACLRVREHPKEGPYVQDLVRQVVTSYDAVRGLLSKGTERRATAVTHYHEHSSRSHAIFTIHFKQAKLDANLPCETVSKINLVDLAGSERADSRGLATDTDRNRLKEGANINKSLVTLASVIKALADASQVATTSSVTPGKSAARSLATSPCFEDSEPGLPLCSTSTSSQRKSCKGVFIPYRDSVLTWLLKDSLGGNAKTIMIATISPSSWCYRETMSTLRYAQRAMSIVNTPFVNEDSHVRLIRELRTEIARLRLLLEANQSNIGSHMATLESNSVIAKKLLQDEEMANCLYADWVDSWAETRDIIKESDVSIRRSASSSCQSSGIVIDSERPHLVGMDPDILHTSILIYNIKEGLTTIGSSSSCEPPDITIDGPGIEKQHCCLEYSLPDAQGNGGYVILRPNSGASCNVNGQIINEPFRLSQGDVIMLGLSRLFRFNHPSEAAELRRRRLSLADLELPIRRHHSDFELFFHGGPTTLSHSNSTSSVLTSGIDCESPSPVGCRSSLTHDGTSSDSCTLWCPSSPSRTTAEEDSLTECSCSADLSNESSWSSRMLSRRHATAIWREENRLATLARRERHLAALIAAHEVLQERAHREVAAAKDQLEDERKQHTEQVRSDLQALIILRQGYQRSSKDCLQRESGETVQSGVASATSIACGTTQATQTDSKTFLKDSEKVPISTEKDANLAERNKLEQESCLLQEHLKAAAQKELVLRCKELKQESAIRSLEATFTKDMMRCQQNIAEVQMQLDLLNKEENQVKGRTLPGSMSPCLKDSDSRKLSESAGDAPSKATVTLIKSDIRASSKNFAKGCLSSATAAASVSHTASVTGTESRRYHLSPSAASVTSRLYPQKTALHKRGSSSGNAPVIRSSGAIVGAQKTIQAKRALRLAGEKHARGSTRSGDTSCRPPLTRSRRLISNSSSFTTESPLVDPGRNSTNAGGLGSRRPRYASTTDTSTTDASNTDELVEMNYWPADSSQSIAVEPASSGSTVNLSEKALETIVIFRRPSVCLRRSRSLFSVSCTVSPQVCSEPLVEVRRSKSLPSKVICSNRDDACLAARQLQEISSAISSTARTINIPCGQGDRDISYASIYQSNCTAGDVKVRQSSTETRAQQFQEAHPSLKSQAHYTGETRHLGIDHIAEILPQSDGQIVDSHYDKRLATYGFSDHAITASRRSVEDPGLFLKFDNHSGAGSMLAKDLELSCSAKATLLCDTENGSSTAKEDDASESDTWSDDSLTERDAKVAVPIKNKSSMAIQGGTSSRYTKKTQSNCISTAQGDVAARHAFQCEFLTNLQRSSGQYESTFPADVNSCTHTSIAFAARPKELTHSVSRRDPGFPMTICSQGSYNVTAECEPFEQILGGSTCFPAWSSARSADDSQKRDVFQYSKHSCDPVVPPKEDAARTAEFDIESDARQLRLDQPLSISQICESVMLNEQRMVYQKEHHAPLTNSKMTDELAIDRRDQADDLSSTGLGVELRLHAPLSDLPTTAAELEATHRHLANEDKGKEADITVRKEVSSEGTKCGAGQLNDGKLSSLYSGITDDYCASGTVAVEECSAYANTYHKGENTHSSQRQREFSKAVCFPSLICDKTVTILEDGGLKSHVKSLATCKSNEFTFPLTDIESLKDSSGVPGALKTSRSEALNASCDCKPCRDSKISTSDEQCATLFHSDDHPSRNTAESQINGGGDARQSLDSSDSESRSITHEISTSHRKKDFTVFSNKIRQFVLDQLKRAKESCKSSPELGAFCTPKKVLRKKDRNCVSAGGFTFADQEGESGFLPREGNAGTVNHDLSDMCIANKVISSDFPAGNFDLGSPRQLPSPATSDASGDSLIFVYVKHKSPDDILLDDDLLGCTSRVNCFDVMRSRIAYTQKMRRFQRLSHISRHCASWAYAYKFSRTCCLKRSTPEQSFHRIRSSRRTLTGRCCMPLDDSTHTVHLNDVKVAMLDESGLMPREALADAETNSVSEQVEKAFYVENGSPTAMPLAFARFICQSDSAVATVTGITVDSWMSTVSSNVLRQSSLEGLRPAANSLRQLAKKTEEDAKIIENNDTSGEMHCRHDGNRNLNQSASHNKVIHRNELCLDFALAKADVKEQCAIKSPKVVPSSTLNLQSIAVQCDEPLHANQQGFGSLSSIDRWRLEVEQHGSHNGFAPPGANSCHSTLSLHGGLATGLLEHIRDGADGAEKEDQLQQLQFDMQTDTADLSREKEPSVSSRGLNSDNQSATRQNVPKSRERYTLGRLTFDMQTSTTTLSTCMDPGSTKRRLLSSAKIEAHDLEKDPGTNAIALATVQCRDHQSSPLVPPCDELKGQSAGTLPECGQHRRSHPTSKLIARTRKASRQKCGASLKKRQGLGVSTSALLRMLLRATAKTCRARTECDNLTSMCSRSHQQLNEKSGDTSSGCSDFMWYDCASVEQVSDQRIFKESAKSPDAELPNPTSFAATTSGFDVSTLQQGQVASVNTERASSGEMQTVHIENTFNEGYLADERCPDVGIRSDSNLKITTTQNFSQENLKAALLGGSFSSSPLSLPICLSRPSSHDACNTNDKSGSALPVFNGPLPDSEFKTTHKFQKEIAMSLTTPSCLRQSEDDLRNVSPSEFLGENSSMLHPVKSIHKQYDHCVAGGALEGEFKSTEAAVRTQSVAYQPSSRKTEIRTDGNDDAGIHLWLHSQSASRDESVETDFINPELERLRKERQHIIQLLAQGYLPSRLWQELAEAQLNYAFGQTDALLEALEEVMSNNSDEEEEAARISVPLTQAHDGDRIVEISREYQERYKAELEMSKQHIEERIRVLEEEAIRAKAERVKTKNKLELLKKKRQAEIDIFKLERSRELHGSSLTRKSSLSDGVASLASERDINSRLRKNIDAFEQTTCEKENNNDQCLNSNQLSTDQNCLTSPKSHLRHLTRIRQNLLADQIDRAETMQNSALETRSSTQTENSTEPLGEAAKDLTYFEKKEDALAVASLLYEAETIRQRSNDELRIAREAVVKSQCLLTENAEKDAYRLSVKAPSDEYCLTCSDYGSSHQISSEITRSMEQLSKSVILSTSPFAISAARDVQAPLQQSGRNSRLPDVLHSRHTTAQHGESLLVSSNRLTANSRERTSLASIKTSEEIEREIDNEIERLRNSFAIIPNQRQDESFY